MELKFRAAKQYQEAHQLLKTIKPYYKHVISCQTNAPSIIRIFSD